MDIIVEAGRGQEGQITEGISFNMYTFQVEIKYGGYNVVQIILKHKACF
jgi:hypothetical protein